MAVSLFALRVILVGDVMQSVSHERHPLHKWTGFPPATPGRSCDTAVGELGCTNQDVCVVICACRFDLT